jgi:hypothetical protein
MRTSYFAELEARVRADWEHLSTQVTPSGVRCVGYAPYLSSKAWLHRFYPGTSERDLQIAEASIRRKIPAPWREALLVQNGLDLFLTKINLTGALPGGQLSRSVDDFQPISLDTANLGPRPDRTAVASEDFVIGGSSLGAGSIYVLRPNGSVAKIDRPGKLVIADWPSVEEMLNSEYATVAAMHDRDGTYHRP